MHLWICPNLMWKIYLSTYIYGLRRAHKEKQGWRGEHQEVHRKILHLNKFVKLAHPTDQLRAEIVNVDTSFTERMVRTMINHYDYALASLIRAMGKSKLTKEDYYSTYNFKFFVFMCSAYYSNITTM